MRSSSRATTEIDRKGQGGEFITEALLSSMFAQKISELAMQQDVEDRLWGFCEKRIREHTRLQDSLRALSRRRQLDIPLALDGERQSKADEVGALKGMLLEESYCRNLIDCLQQMVEAFEKAGADAEDGAVQAIANLNLASLKADLDKVQEIEISCRRS